MDKKEALIAIRRVVEEGWCQKKYHAKLPDGSEQHCLVGACKKVLGENLCSNPLYGPVCDELHNGTRPKDIVAWNDEPGRTQDQVISMLDAVIYGCGSR